MAAGLRIEHQNCAFQSSPPAFPEIIEGDITPTQVDEQRLAIAYASPMTEHILNVKVGEIALRQPL